MTEPTDLIQNDDEIVKKLVKEITTAGSLSKRVHSELELEQAKGKLVVSELKREMLKLEELLRESMSNETYRLKTLMVNQLIEINKQEVLANIHRELIKQREKFLVELPEGIPTPNELSKEEKREVETVEILSPVADFLSAEDKASVEGDIQRIEGKIAKAEKEQITIKQCLVRHQELLDELKLLEDFTNRNEPPVTEIYERGAQISEVQIEKPDGQFKNGTENYEDGTSSNFNGNSTSGATTMNVKPTGLGGGILQHIEIEKGTNYGPYNAAGKNSAFVLKTAKRMNRIGTLCNPKKRSKLDLYDVSTKISKEVVDCERDESLKKIVHSTFIPKTPSHLARRIVVEKQ